MKQFKIRSSGISHIMGGTMGLTAKQEIEYGTLLHKEKRTAIQDQKFVDLRHKRENPQLPEGAKTYCENWLKEQLYDKKKEITSKYFEKGNTVEAGSIEYVAKHRGYGFLIKNEDYYENEFVTGTPDVVVGKKEVIDVKSSWDCFTFPLFEEKQTNRAYWWQLQGYMYLTGIPNAQLMYVLMDMPDSMIMADFEWKNPDGLEYEEFEKKYKYSDLSFDLRIKAYSIAIDPSAINAIKDRVEHCRIYIETLKTNNKL